MTSVYAAHALVQGEWRENVRIAIAGGRIAGVESGASHKAGDEHHHFVIPTMPNLHSHAFQRGMAGLAERRHTSSDTFWSWREVMYRFALSMTPEHIEAVAAQLYVEMLESGFTRVGEFHYLHHQIDGTPYKNSAELAARVAAAAEKTGIGLTLLPVFYAHASFGGAQPADSQRRFINTIDSYSRLLEGCRDAVKSLENGVVGVAPHSLRAVTPEELSIVRQLAGSAPIHIHISEQMREVEECLLWSKQRPIEWLLDHMPVSAQWCLVHATHMTGDETKRMAESGAIAGLCPITEANLGDGVFNAVEYLQHGGRYGVGSDSNIQIGVAEELRLLEYSQRLLRRSRNVLASPNGSTGRAMFDTARSGGATALGVGSFDIAIGATADMLSLRQDHPALAACRTGDDILDAWIFAAGTTLVDCVWAQGRKVVESGRHRHRDEIAAKFTHVMRDLSTS